MPRILYFSRDYTVHDQRFLTALAKTEHQVFFLRLEKGASGMDEKLLPPEIQLVNWAGGKEVYLDAQRARLSSGLKQVIKQIKPDLIQAGPLHLSAYLAARSGFQPLVSMSWGYDLLYEAKQSPQAHRAIRYTLSHSAAMVGDCRTVRQLAISYGMPDERIVTFPWGIDLDRYRLQVERFGRLLPLTFNVQRSTIILLSNRAWEPMYGVDVIARAFVQAAKNHPELRLVMLGNGTQAALIRQTLQDGGVLDRVQFPGQVGEADLPRYYRETDLYLSASHSDGTSISLLEAMASGTPVIVSDIPGNREWVEPGAQGWLFPDGDANALAQCILNAIARRDLLPEMGRAARALAEQRADWDRNFPELFKAYQIAFSVDRSTLNV
jgi:glycosyltransferase involved in cell wall biosynthesis